MAEKLNLNRFKSSGVYTIEIDESQNLALPISTGRLVIGSSKKGPINSVALIQDSKTLQAVYGDTDSKLEKNGSYFHRTLDVALRQGPVFGLNILPVSSTELAYFRTFNSEPASTNSLWAENINQSSMSNFYNVQKLWFADVDMVNKWKNIKLGDDYIYNPSQYGTADRDSNKILTVVNLSCKEITAFVRVADVTGYDITVKEYFALLGDKTEVPEYLNPDDIVQDYFVELIVVEGNWTDNLKLASDPVYKQYFTSTGLINSKINDFTALKEVTLIAKTQGCIIPGFRDLTGTIVALDTVFNRNFPTTGVYCAIDYKKVDIIDLSNSTFDSGSATEPMEEQRLDLVGYGIDDLNLYNGTKTAYVVDDGITGTEPVGLIDVLSYKKPLDSNFYFLLSTYVPTYIAGEVYINTAVTPNTIVATENSKLYNAWFNGFVKNGDYLKYAGGPSLTPTSLYIASDGAVKLNGSVKYITFNVFSDITRLNQVSAQSITDAGDDFLWMVNATSATYKKDFDLTDTDYFMDGDYQYTYTAPNQITFYIDPTLYGNPNKNETPNTAAGYPYNSTRRAEIDNFFKVGQYLKAEVVAGTERGRMLRITSVYAQKVSITGYGPSSSAVTVLKYTVKTAAPIDVNNRGINFDGTTIRAYKGIKNFVTSIAGYSIPAMNLDDFNLYPNGTAERQNIILDFMFNGSNLASTLADGETLDFRYLIDSFEGQIYPGSKQQLAQLAADHGKLLVIANAPSFAQYERSVSPRFIDPVTRLVSAQSISTGGDLNSNPEFLFSFATGEKNGIPLSSYVSYFMPNIIIYENGKNKSIPPAMFVANTFMKKYTSGNTFSIVAGKRGILTDPEITGIEYDLINEDRDYLEPAGFNLIVRRRGFGVMVFSNNTGYQRVKSALNNTHVREALITIERDIERILLNFLFDWNDVTTRMRVKTMVKNYLAAVEDARGISWYDVIFDDSNNGTEVLENNAGVVDILVDFPRGIHKFINRITITRVGGQLSSQSTGFTPSF
jgi:hypothetical protein